jgi:hypothetical protein
LAEQPLAGWLFEILEPGVRGLQSLEYGPFEYQAQSAPHDQQTQ